MSTPPPSNILTDPVSELTEAIRTNLFGIDHSSAVLVEQSFPVTAEDKESVRAESKQRASTSERVIGKARIILLEGDALEVSLDRRGYTLETATSTSGKTYPHTTYESIETLLIAVSPAYVAAMTNEVSKRFHGYVEAENDGQSAQTTGVAPTGEMSIDEALKGFHGDEKK